MSYREKLALALPHSPPFTGIKNVHSVPHWIKSVRKKIRKYEIDVTVNSSNNRLLGGSSNIFSSNADNGNNSDS